MLCPKQKEDQSFTISTLAVSQGRASDVAASLGRPRYPVCHSACGKRCGTMNEDREFIPCMSRYSVPLALLDYGCSRPLTDDRLG